MIVATLERIAIVDAAENLAHMIVQSEVADEYRRCFYILKRDETAQQLIAHFVKLKERYEEVQRFGKYHPDYKEVMTQVREAKRALDLHESIAAFKRAENDLQSLLDEVSALIGKAVSEHVKVPTGNPYFDSLPSCGGCGAGGSCGCKTK